MTAEILNRRSTLLYDRPFPSLLGVGEIALNVNQGDPGLYFSDSTQSYLLKIGPTFVGSNAPNFTPTGHNVLSKGESWLDISSTQILKIHDGTAWQPVKAVSSIGTGKPSDPLNGQLHFDKSISALCVYDATSLGWWTSNAFTFVPNPPIPGPEDYWSSMSVQFYSWESFAYIEWWA